MNAGDLVITISGLSIPEPATSTLSLLALAALAARRRRRN
ncbi:MAG: PEP-CTERM sorting domain-containing protein [Akkermansia sp.]|nr:PEP-CTERM sorting domain-containing protein [Akkermansia sp.]